MATPDKVNFAGDVKIEEVSIINTRGFLQDVTAQTIGIEIYEDIFSPFITGKIMLLDSQEITNLFPLVGEEVVRLHVKTPSLSDDHAYKGEYYIYKMDDKIKTSERQTALVLHFISKEAIVDLNKKISKAYSGKVSDIVKKLITEPDALDSPKQYNIEETKTSTKFISNYWSPVKCLRYLTDNAVNNENSPTYLFYENKYGLNFVSLDSLYSKAPLFQKFVWDNYSADIKKTGSSERNISQDYMRVLEFHTPETFDYMNRVQSGMYGAELIAYDILTKQYTHLNYQPKWEDTKHLNNYPLWSEKAVARPDRKSVV